MSKTTAPLLSIGAGGQIGKTQVYSKWRGIPYVRKYVIPANPRSANQTKTRSVFSWLNAVWKLMSSDAQAPWTAYSSGQPFTNRNGWLSKNIKALRPGTDLTAIVGSPGANGGLASQSATYTGGSGSITVAATQPTPPTGWTLSGMTAVAITAQDPHSGTNYTSYSQAASSPYDSADITVPAGDYEVTTWPIWTKPDGTTAYGPSLSGTATAT